MNDQQNPLMTLFLIGGLAFLLMSGPCQKPPETSPPATTIQAIDRLTYVYEKDEGGVPSAVLAALSALELSDASVRVSVFEDDTTDGDGQVPEQFKSAKAAAEKHGSPCVVSEASGQVIAVVLSPRTKDDVLKALSP